jgi:hypothetical protein
LIMRFSARSRPSFRPSSCAIGHELWPAGDARPTGWPQGGPVLQIPSVHAGFGTCCGFGIRWPPARPPRATACARARGIGPRACVASRFVRVSRLEPGRLSDQRAGTASVSAARSPVSRALTDVSPGWDGEAGPALSRVSGWRAAGSPANAVILSTPTHEEARRARHMTRPEAVAWPVHYSREAEASSKERPRLLLSS